MLNPRIVSLRRGMEELESRVTSLEEQVSREPLLGVKSHHLLKNAHKHVNELTFQAEEQRSNMAMMVDRVGHLQDQLRTYAAHLQDVRQVADANLAKYRQAQLAKDLAGVEEEHAKTAGMKD